MADFRAFVERYMASPMQWGVDDCSLFIADWWRENHGSDPAAHLRSTYSTEAEKEAIVSDAGGLLRLVGGIAKAVGAKPARRARVGDFGVIAVGGNAIAAIFAGGGFWAARSNDGVAFTRDARPLRVWTIGGCDDWLVPQRMNKNMGKPWLAPSPHYVEDPLSVGVAFLVNIGWGGTISALGATLVGSAILGAAALGLSFVSNAIFSPQNNGQPKQSDPQQRQATVRQSIGARTRYYGRVKVGGTMFFFEVNEGTLFTGLTLNEGRIHGVAEYWLNDSIVEVDGAGFVTSFPYTNGAGAFAQIHVKLGTDDQTVHSQLDAAFADVDASHRLRGVANVLTIFNEVTRDMISAVYPQLNPQIRIVMDASVVKSVRTGTVAWSDNPADAIYDYLTGRDGAGFAYGSDFEESLIDLPSFQHMADISDEITPRKDGGTVKRYRLWGGYSLNEKMKDVLPRMLATCDGDLYMTSAGKVAIRGGEWVAPQLTLDDQAGHIISHEFSRGTGALAAFNELTITYMEPTLDYQEVEAERWVDQTNLALVGKPTTARLSLEMVPHHAQARRLGKIHTHKSNPKWQGRLITNFYGFNAIGERTVRLKISVLGIDEDFLVRRVTILPDMTGVELQVTSLSAAAYAWDAELEEGTAPGQPPDTSTPVDLPPPEDFAVTVKERDVSGTVVGLYLEATWTEPSRPALWQQVQYRLSPSGDWFDMSVSDGVGLAESGIISDGADYDVQARTRAPAGTPGEWSSIITVNASV